MQINGDLNVEGALCYFLCWNNKPNLLRFIGAKSKQFQICGCWLAAFWFRFLQRFGMASQNERNQLSVKDSNSMLSESLLITSFHRIPFSRSLFHEKNIFTSFSLPSHPHYNFPQNRSYGSCWGFSLRMQCWGRSEAFMPPCVLMLIPISYT